jgi:transcriptional regulator with XRE-family HTH domain
MEIGEKIRSARESCGLTQEAAAEKIMVSRQTISNWETGKSLPDIHSVIKMSELYGVSLDDLLKGDEKMLKKIEGDEKRLDGNKRELLVIGLTALAAVVIYFISIAVGGAFHEFWTAAMPYVMTGLGLLCVIFLIPSSDGKKS